MTIHIRHADRGSETVETAVLVGLALVLLVSVVQAALWWHTRSVCLHAAATGLAAARTLNPEPGAAGRATADFLARAPSATTDPTTNVEASGETVTVRVSATAPRLLPIPGLEFRVTQTASAQRERFTYRGGAS